MGKSIVSWRIGDRLLIWLRGVAESGVCFEFEGGYFKSFVIYYSTFLLEASLSYHKESEYLGKEKKLRVDNYCIGNCFDKSWFFITNDDNGKSEIKFIVFLLNSIE